MVRTLYDHAETVKKIFFLLLAVFFVHIVHGYCASQLTPGPEGNESQVPALKIYDAQVRPVIFNPSAGESVTISYSLTHRAKSRVRIMSPDMFPVAELINRDYTTETAVSLSWDGRDFSGMVVPDQAYIIQIEAEDLHGDKAFYNPVETNRWEIKRLGISREGHDGRMTYVLPCNAWVQINTGVANGGPLLGSITRWQPSLYGEHSIDLEELDPFSASAVISGDKDIRIIGSYLKIPDNSLVATGNGELSYQEYSADVITQGVPGIRVKHLPDLSGRNIDRKICFGSFAPIFNISLRAVGAGDKKDLPVLKGIVPIKIFLDKRVRKYIIGQRLEMLGFVDFKFAEENEEGYSPFTWMLDTRNWPDGEHVITVNVVTLRGEIAARSMKAIFRNRAGNATDKGAVSRE